MRYCCQTKNFSLILSWSLDGNYDLAWLQSNLYSTNLLNAQWEHQQENINYLESFYKNNKSSEKLNRLHESLSHLPTYVFVTLPNSTTITSSSQVAAMNYNEYPVKVTKTQCPYGIMEFANDRLINVRDWKTVEMKHEINPNISRPATDLDSHTSSTTTSITTSLMLNSLELGAGNEYDREKKDSLQSH